DFPPEEVPNNQGLLGSNVSRPDDVLLTRFDAAALVPVLQGRQILIVHVERASDILQTLALKKEFPSLKLVLVGAAEGWTVAREIAAAGVPVIASALTDLPNSFEQLGSTQSNIGRMRAAGVAVSIGMIDDEEARQVRLSRQYAGNLVAIGRLPGTSGLTWGQALQAITSAAAVTAFVGSHFALSHPLRLGLVRSLGEARFTLLYSAVALLTFMAILIAYRSVGESYPLWIAPRWGYWVAAALMLFASILLVGSVIRNPAFPHPGAEKLAWQPPAGVFAITRHPMNWSFATWAI